MSGSPEAINHMECHGGASRPPVGDGVRKPNVKVLSTRETEDFERGENLPRILHRVLTGLEDSIERKLLQEFR